ncbi:MAG: helix-turn-helix domain-containing protein [Roseivirga sp.]
MEKITLTHLSDQELQELIQEAMKVTWAQLPPTPPAASEHALLTTEGASKLLALAPSTIYGLVHQQEIPHMKRGNRLYFSRQELLEWVGKQRRATRSEWTAQAVAYFEERSRSQAKAPEKSSTE